MEFRLILPLVLLCHFTGLSTAGVCSPGCICIPGVTSICSNSSTVIDWSDLLGANSPSVVNVELGSFENGDFVTQLDLSENPSLTLQSGSFQGLVNLNSLDLSDCELTSLPDKLFTPLVNLVHLDLGRNDLTFVNPAAFEGLVNLQTIVLSFNQLTSFPHPDLLPHLPALTEITLYPNPIDCSNGNITLLLQLVNSNIIADDNALRCSNGTLVRDLTFVLPTSSATMVTSTSFIISPTSTSVPIISPTPSATITRGSPMTTSTPLATPPPVLPCSAETTLTSTGYFDWPQTQPTSTATHQCPTNGKAAYRMCMASGTWGRVNDLLCDIGSAVVQLLASINEVSVTAETSEGLSLQLATTLTSDLQLSSQELNTLTDITEQLVAVAGDNVQVLNNTLQSLDVVLISSEDSLMPATANRLRSLIDTILLDALSQNQTSLVFSFSHLAVGGAYLPPSNQSHLLAVIQLGSNNTVGIELGGETEGNVTVEIDGGEGDVQVTVYDGDNLFNQSNCSNTTEGGVMGGDIVTPVISVTNENIPSGDNEVVTITYGRVSTSQGHMTVCVRWNPVTCGGGVWTMSGCALVTSSTGQLQCRCVHQGTYAILDVPVEPTTGEGQLSLISRALFYTLTSLTLPLYLTIIITVLSSRLLRPLPTAQCLVFLSLSQGLSLLVMELAHGLTDVRWLCYSLGVLLQYTLLVSLSWMVVYPVLVAFKVFRTMWYEKTWLIAPFAAVAWVWPAIPVGIYSGLKHSEFTEQPQLCWLEYSAFPNTFTYVSGITGLIVLATAIISLLLLACSDYTLEVSIYFQIISLMVNFVLYAAVIITQFFTASADQFNVNQSYLLMATGGLALICGVYFFIANGIAKSRIRSAITCRMDPVLKNKIGNYGNNPDDSGFSSRTSPMSRGRRLPVRLTDELNINYVDDYLGYPHTSPVPLAMISQVQDGSRVNSRKNSDIAGQMFSNPLYSMQVTSEV